MLWNSVVDEWVKKEKERERESKSNEPQILAKLWWQTGCDGGSCHRGAKAVQFRTLVFVTVAKLWTAWLAGTCLTELQCGVQHAQ